MLTSLSLLTVRLQCVGHLPDVFLRVRQHEPRADVVEVRLEPLGAVLAARQPRLFHRGGLLSAPLVVLFFLGCGHFLEDRNSDN